MYLGMILFIVCVCDKIEKKVATSKFTEVIIVC